VETRKYNLKQLIVNLTAQIPDISAVSIFGSRAYRTGSTRSDCDLLIEHDPSKNVRSSDLRAFATEYCTALDFFIVNGGRATSCSNDSFVYAHSTDELKQKLDAKQVWSKSSDFSISPFDSPDNWVFETRSFVEFGHTVMPDEHISVISWSSILKRAENSGLPITPYIGDSIDKAAAFISDVAKKMILRKEDLCQRGVAKTGWTVNLSSEYDCQNLFYTVLKAWIGNVGREEVTIRYDNQDKIADFNLFDSQLIVEMKFIDSDQKKREVVKTLSGLTDFYKRNSNIKVLLFLVYVKEGIAIDRARWEADYTHVTSATKVITWVIAVP